jgi:ABC-type transport system involved in multi-copper enzyme maturation permease subunit
MPAIDDRPRTDGSPRLLLLRVAGQLAEPARRRTLASAGAALIAAALLWQARWLPYRLVLGAVILTALAVLARRLLPWLLGPVFFYELIRRSRRQRYFLLRAGYAGVVLATLFLFHATWFKGPTLAHQLAGTTVRGDQAARFAEAFFTLFGGVQLGMVLLLAPVFSAGALTEEKERRTLDGLLTTDLTDREIVLGKLAARLASLLLVVLAGLPVLSLVQLLGGVDPGLMLAVFAAALLTMLSLASLGLANSAYCGRTRTALFLTYLEAGVFLVVSGVCSRLAGGVGLLSWPGAGNPLVAAGRLSEAAATGTLPSELWLALCDYAIFHLLTAAACITWACAGLRRMIGRQRSGRAEAVRLEFRTPEEFELVRLPAFAEPPRPRPPLGDDDPIVWKELHFAERSRMLQLAEQTGRRLAGMADGSAERTLSYSVGMGLLAGLAVTLIFAMMVGALNLPTWVRAAGTLVACLMLMAVAVRSAGAISGERERRTLDSLLTTPLDDREILWGKWWASILSVGKAWWCLGAIWGLGVFWTSTCGLSLVAVPLLIAAWFIYAAFASGLGLCFSLTSRSSLRATVWTLLTLAGAAGVPWVWTLNFLASFGSSRNASCDRLAAALFGFLWYAAAAFLLWLWLVERFGQTTGRVSSRAERSAGAG